MADKDYAATREEWADRIANTWKSQVLAPGVFCEVMADYMIAQGWLPVKEPEREPGFYLVKTAESTHLAEWADGDWYLWRDMNGKLGARCRFVEPYTCTRLRPDSEVKG